MIGIGIRVVSDEKVLLCVVERKDDGSFSEPRIVKIVMPQALTDPEQLSYLRNAFIDVLNQYRVTCAAIRIPEPPPVKTKTTNTIIRRTYIEGVLQEALAGSKVTKLIPGRIANFKRLLGLEVGEFLSIVEGVDKFRIPGWSKFSSEEREAILACYSSFNI